MSERRMEIGYVRRSMSPNYGDLLSADRRVGTTKRLGGVNSTLSLPRPKTAPAVALSRFLLAHWRCGVNSIVFGRP